MFLDKLRKMLNISPNEPIKNEQVSKENINDKQENNNAFVLDLEQLMENHYTYLFDILFKSLSGEQRYSDSSTFEKCESTLVQYFERNSIHIDTNIQSQFKSAFEQSRAYRQFAKILLENLEHYSTYPIVYSWSSLNDMIKYVIDHSLENKRPLNSQFARILIGRYYYRRGKSADLPKLYRNLILIISKEELLNWVTQSSDCFEVIIFKVKNRLKKFECVVSDERVLIEVFLKSKPFQYLVNLNPWLLDNAKKSKYSFIVDSVIASEPTFFTTVAVLSANPEKSDKTSTDTSIACQIQTESMTIPVQIVRSDFTKSEDITNKRTLPEINKVDSAPIPEKNSAFENLLTQEKKAVFKEEKKEDGIIDTEVPKLKKKSVSSKSLNEKVLTITETTRNMVSDYHNGRTELDDFFKLLCNTTATPHDPLVGLLEMSMNEVEDDGSFLSKHLNLYYDEEKKDQDITDLQF